MRLLRIDGEDRFSLVEFMGEDTPPYAILSHTWGHDNEEVTLNDITNNTGLNKLGYEKIRFYKTSSAELTESINSMYQWYKEATVCYVALMDLPPHAWRTDELSQCRWFTRGWTLQELLAPQTLEFYDATWKHIGSKHTLANKLSRITGIDRLYLIGGDLTFTSVATKMSWAARRQTKRIEDKAYSMLGLFDVNMPLIYGEGTKAFRRLQEEIIKQSNDLTIFAWDSRTLLDSTQQLLINSLATSPAAFAYSSQIYNYTDDFAEFAITNKGPKLFCRDGSFDLETKVEQGRVCDHKREDYQQEQQPYRKPAFESLEEQEP
ncbi:hypothetical protein CC86DRAFT_389724 [Ophiobolus disseminans]|uniref:DUF8212 domain-containing protein n=1 Tax=Ophiobolus disseminans TaxID=1469910 RepID=A0A6A7AJN4_9PLEO|nr:hypothetical protein CC86DRAFT_389724 [Ophiobolus disseminans]